MNTENLSTLKIHKLTQAQYDREREKGTLDENTLYLTPDEEINLTNYVTKEDLAATKALFVTINEDGTASHSASEINAHCESGGMAWLTTGEFIFPLFVIEGSGDDLIAVFCQNIVAPPNEIQTLACIIDDNKNITEDGAQLNLDTTKDWSQNNPTAKDYIKNRPFYAEPLAGTVLAEFDFTGDGDIQTVGLEKGKIYMLSAGDSKYVSVCKQHTLEGLTGLYLGNPNILDPTSDNTGEPYLLFEIPDMMTAIMTTGNAILAGDHIKIEESAVHKINAGYLPTTSWKDLDVPFGTEYNVEFNSFGAMAAGSHAVGAGDGAFLVRVGDYMDKDDFDRTIMSLIVNGTVVMSGECQHIGIVKPIGEHSYYFVYGEGLQIALSLYSQNDCDLLSSNLIPGLYLMYMEIEGQALYCNLSKPQIKNLGKYIDYFTIPNSPVGTISDAFNVPSAEDNIFGESVDVIYANGDTALFYWILPETYTKEKLAGSTLVFKDGTTRILASTDYEYLIDPEGTKRSEFCKISDIFIWVDTLYTEELHDTEGNVFVPVYPGLYVKTMDNPLVEIRFPDEIRKLDVKYLPDEVLTTESINLLTENGQIGGFKTTSILLDGDNTQVTNTRDLVGATVTNHVQGRRKLVVPAERPFLDGTLYGGVYCNDKDDAKIEMQYGTNDGALSKPCLMLTGPLLKCSCVLLMSENSPYDSLLYAYEETTDNLGVGIVFKPGWYILNKTTFVHEPIDIESSPVYFSNNNCYIVSPTDEVQSFFESIFPLMETITFTITEQHMVSAYNAFRWVFNSPSPYNYDEIIACITALAPNLSLFVALTDVYFSNDKYVDISAIASGGFEWTTITWADATPIDPKFLPDSVFIPTPEAAKIGQTIVVSEVDDNGKPLAWEATTPSAVQLIIWEDGD